jgi:hypothetical protein
MKTIIESIIAGASQIPSGDNSQPWKFWWTGSVLKISHVEDFAVHSLNRKNHASMMAFGALLETLRISASNFGFELKINLRIPDQNLPRESEVVWAEVKMIPSKKAADPLNSALSLRTTDRRNYKGGTLNLHLRSELRALQINFPDCCLHMQEDQSHEFINYFLKAEELLWKNSKIIKDLCRWLRLSKKETKNSTDGMSAKNIGINLPETLLFKLIRKFPRLPSFLWSFGFGFKIKQKSMESIQSSAALICFTVRAITPENLCHLGGLAVRCWLILNREGFGVQPLSYASTSVADATSENSRSIMSTDELELFKQGQKILKKNFNFLEGEVPTWMFRTGVSDSLPQDQRPAKRQLSEVLSFKSDFQESKNQLQIKKGA